MINKTSNRKGVTFYYPKITGFIIKSMAQKIFLVQYSAVTVMYLISDHKRPRKLPVNSPRGITAHQLLNCSNVNPVEVTDDGVLKTAGSNGKF